MRHFLPRARLLLAVTAALALGVTFWTWRVLECIPLEVSGNDGYWYTECEAPTTFARLLINVLLLAAVSGAAFALQRAGRLLLRYHSRQ